MGQYMGKYFSEVQIPLIFKTCTCIAKQNKTEQFFYKQTKIILEVKSGFVHAIFSRTLIILCSIHLHVVYQCRFCAFVNFNTVFSFSILWPTQKVQKGDECTRDFLYGIGEEKQRSARLSAWYHTPQNYFVKVSIYLE